MTPEQTIDILRFLKEHREYDEDNERWIIDVDELEGTLLGLERASMDLAPPTTYHFVDVPVIDGTATLPDGRTVRSDSQVVRVPIFDEPVA